MDSLEFRRNDVCLPVATTTARQTSSRRGDEIGSIILFNDVRRTVRKLFDLHKSERRLVSCRRALFMRLSDARSRTDVFLVDKSAESCPIFSPAAKIGPPRRSLLYDIARLPRARGKYIARTNAPWEWRLRETSARAGTPEYLNVDGRSEHAGSETTIYNVDPRRSLNLRRVRGAP